MSKPSKSFIRNEFRYYCGENSKCSYRKTCPDQGNYKRFEKYMIEQGMICPYFENIHHRGERNWHDYFTKESD